MKKSKIFNDCVNTYGEQNNIKMNWFRTYVKVVLPFLIFIDILSTISFLGQIYSNHDWSI